MQLATASVLTFNKLQFLLGDVWDGRRSASVQASADHPFEHAETTPNTLGPLFDLDTQTPPHLVFVVVEGLGRSFSGPDARLGSFTPFLDELAKKSLYWENFLATQGRTFAVLPSVLGSLPFGPYGEQHIAHDNLLSLLKGQGYSLRYFTGTDLAFDHQGDFLAASGVKSFWSERDFVAPARKLSEWGYSDADLLQAVAQSPMPIGPSVTVVQTMSMHTPFVVLQPEKYLQQFESRMDTLGLTQAQRASYRKQKEIYASILFTDDALRVFFDQVSAKPEWQNTVWVITGDHRLPEIPMASRIERYHVPLIVYSPLLRRPLRIKALSSHFDIAPSLLAMLSHRYGMSSPKRVHWMGTGLDVHPQWRNLHTLPIKQTKTELSDFVSGEYYLAQDKLYNLQDGLATAPEDFPWSLVNLEGCLVW
jgi:phosphoglycerol transferase MdoB-like AlkP superfamily enzyme